MREGVAMRGCDYVGVAMRCCDNVGVAKWWLVLLHAKNTSKSDHIQKR